MNLSNFYDRNPNFKEVTKNILSDFINRMNELIVKMTIKYYEIKRSDKITEEKNKEYDNLKDEKEFW